VGERARARGFGFLGAMLSAAGAALDVSTTLYALKRVPGTREINVLSAKVQVALMLANPWTTLLWALLHVLTPLLLFFAADALYPRLRGRVAPLIYLAPVAYGAVAWCAAVNNLAIALGR
jgi:hypothetical protein